MLSLKRSLLPLMALLLLGNAAWQLARHPEVLQLANPATWLEAPAPHTGSFTDEPSYRLPAGTLARDPYADVLSREEFKEFERETSQEYVGVGILLGRFPIDYPVSILKVFPDTPAERGGLHPGDRIVAVNGRDMRDATTGELVEAIAGPSGSSVALTIERSTADKPLPVTLVRSAVAFTSVDESRVLDDGSGYIRINEFARRTATEVCEALEQLEGQGISGLILDLRANPGGMLDAAVAVAELFLEPGDLVVTTRPLRGQEREVGGLPGFDRGDREEALHADDSASPRAYPVAVLIDQASASAAEIVAGALQAHGRAVLVGETSFGKGSIQSIIGMRNGEGLKLTTAEFLLPSGQSIEGEGVTPDVREPLKPEEGRRLALQQVHLPYLGPEAFEERFGFAPIEDRQVAAAQSALREPVGQVRP
ncbi:MAG: S41 family peptidase [Opitutales bacterium]